MSDGYEVDVEALDLVAEGIDGAMTELQGLGLMGIGAGGMGRGFEKLALTRMEAGEPFLATAFASFCERWEWGVRALVQDGNVIAEKLQLSAGLYRQQEQYALGTLKETAVNALGNPHASNEGAADRSWRDIGSDNVITQAMDADYSQESFQDANEQGQRAVSDEAADVVATNADRWNAVTGADDDDAGPVR